MTGQVNGENAPCTRDVADSENSVVCLDVAPADGQSESETRAIHAASAVNGRNSFSWPPRGRPPQ